MIQKSAGDFIDWLDEFTIFLKGYYCALPLELRCRSATDIMADAVKAYKRCGGSNWLEKKDEEA